jgi:hypothetical protein
MVEKFIHRKNETLIKVMQALSQKFYDITARQAFHDRGFPLLCSNRPYHCAISAEFMGELAHFLETALKITDRYSQS